MKATTRSKDTRSFEVDALPDEYRFDYSKAKPNRFAEAFEEKKMKRSRFARPPRVKFV